MNSIIKRTLTILAVILSVSLAIGLVTIFIDTYPKAALYSMLGIIVILAVLAMTMEKRY